MYLPSESEFHVRHLSLLLYIYIYVDVCLCRHAAAWCWACGQMPKSYVDFMEPHVVRPVCLPTWKALQYLRGIAISYAEIFMLWHSKSYVDLMETYVVSPACLPTWKISHNTYEVL